MCLSTANVANHTTWAQGKQVCYRAYYVQVRAEGEEWMVIGE